jgi:hypothetical protein
MVLKYLVNEFKLLNWLNKIISNIYLGIFMFKIINYNLLITVVSVLISSFSVHANTQVNINQSGDNISWQVSGNTYSIQSVNLTVSGSSDTETSLTGCTSLPLNCTNSFNSTVATIDTSDFSEGNYSWEINIVPLTSNSICDVSDVRELQGGLQGLSNQGDSTPEDIYLTCLRNSGIIPLDDEELKESGVFVIGGSSGLIVPDDSNTTPSDNALPVALCMDVSIDGSNFNCSVIATIDNGSYDPDGTLVDIVQNPDGPFTLGTTNVTLTVTDNEGGSNSCSSNVTVTDSLAPIINCPLVNTMSPNTAPATFTATSTDTCSIPVTQVTSFDCYRFNPNGNRINTNDSCVVSTNIDGITVVETSGVNSFVDWTIESTDSEGNSSSSVCTVEVLHPNG